jgi:hypothetical protein
VTTFCFAETTIHPLTETTMHAVQQFFYLERNNFSPFERNNRENFSPIERNERE